MTQDKNKTKAQLIDELVDLRIQLATSEDAESALLEGEERYRSHFENAPLGYQSLDANGTMLECNDTWCRMLGYKKDEVLGRNFSEFIHPDYAEVFKENFPKFKKVGYILGIEFEMIKKDGSEIVVAFDGRIGHDDRGSFRQTHCVFQDITERKRAADEAWSAKAFLNNIINAIADPVFVKDDERRFVLVNDALCTIVGRPREELLGEDGDDMFPQEQVAIFREMDARVLTTGEENVNEESLSNLSSGEVSTIVTRKTLYIDPAGKRFLVGVFRDITERKQMEEALRESEDRLSDIIFSVADWVWEVDENGAYTYSSDKGYDLLGRIPEEVIGMTPFHFMPPDEAKRVGAIFSEIAAKKEPIRDLENWNIRKNGERVCLLTNAVPILDGAGNLSGYRGVDRDITERKQAEEELLQYREQLEEMVEERTAELKIANKGLEDFAYSVSHDLKTPVRAIVGFSEIISDRHRDSLNEEGQRHFEYINKAGTHMGHLIEDLLRYCQLGRSAVNKQPVPLAEVFSELERTFLGRVKEIGGSLVLPNDAPTVLGDRTLLSQIFTNLIDNGLSYHRPDVAPQVDIRFRTEGNRVLVSVEDNGIGIAAEYHEKVFGVFQRLHNDEAIPGTGIGLALVQKAATILGANVRLESVVGEGCTFHVELPLSKEQ